MFFISTGCDDASTDNGNIFQLELNGGEASTTLTAGNSGAEFILIPHSAPNTSVISGSANYILQLSSANAKLSSSFSKILPKPTTEKYSLPQEIRARLMARMSHENDRDRHIRSVASMWNSKIVDEGWNQEKLEALYPQGVPQLVQGKTVNFSFTSTLTIASPFSGEEGQTVAGTLLANDSNAAIYLDDRDAGSLTASEATLLLATFGTLTVPRVRAFAGSETDINGDGGVVIFMSSAIQQNVLGFFRPTDLLPDEVDPNSDSNQMEILYAAIPDNGQASPLVNATLAHEFAHLVDFGNKTLPGFLANGNLNLEVLSVEEGKAHLAEDLAGFGGGDTFAVAGECLNNINEASAAGTVASNLQTSSSDPNDSLARRGCMMLLLRYLFEQSGSATYSSTQAGQISGGGVNFFRSLNASSLSGLPNLADASGMSPDAFYGNWVAALYLDGTSLSSDPRYNYEEEIMDALTGQPRGFNLRGTRLINNQTSLTLTGPDIQQVPLSDPSSVNGDVFLSGSNFLFFTLSAGGSIGLDYSTDPDSSPGFTVIKLE